MIHDVITRGDVMNVLMWCMNKFGMSEYNPKRPFLRVYKSSGTTLKIKGEYKCDTNTIVIYLGVIDSYFEMCSIMIHEYTHYLQSCDEYDEIYYQMKEDGYSEKEIYKNHPHEKKCNEAAQMYVNMCVADCSESDE